MTGNRSNPASSHLFPIFPKAITAAEIIDGEYTLKSQFGILGGAYHVTVSGNDGVVAEDFPVGKPLFSDYKIDHDFKEGENTFDVDVPKKR